MLSTQNYSLKIRANTVKKYSLHHIKIKKAQVEFPVYGFTLNYFCHIFIFYNYHYTLFWSPL